VPAPGHRRKKRSPALVGLIALVVIAVVLFLGFTKHIPFTHGYILKAQFESANNIRVNSPVRIAGVEVGKVKKVEPLQGTNAAVLVMDLKKDALPIHTDATAKIRPRIFLEGNFFVDLQPGTPGSPDVPSGGIIKVSQTSTPVQLDQVLTALQGDSRADLQHLLHGLNVALNAKPTAADDADADPSTRGKTGAEAFNAALSDVPAGERSTAIVLNALLGTEPDKDVTRLIRGTAATATALDQNEGDLKDLITNFNDTMATFAGESDNLRASIRELAPTLQNANSAFTSLNAAFPPTRAFAREILPGVKETPATINAAFPWITQTRKLVSKQELGGLAEELSPATADLARLVDRAEALLPQTDLAAKCVRDVVLPAGDEVVHDRFDDGAPNYKEFFYALVGIAGEGQNTDGNGMYVRFQTGGGTQSVSLGSAGSSTGQLFGNNPETPLGNQPAYPGKHPPYNPTYPCYKNPLPDVNGPAAAISAPTGSSTTQRVSTAQDKLRRQAALEAVRAKLNPFARRAGVEAAK
jgi:phospholipid/cholesterol/gamma-HCH transport system substrate-binding protein